MEITVTVNGKAYTKDVAPNLLLVDFLHDSLGLTGTKSDHFGGMHSVAQRRLCEKLFHPGGAGGWRGGGDGGRTGPKRPTQSPATSILGQPRGAERLFYSRDAVIIN